MHQLILVVGIVLASSMGLALLALVLKSSLRNSRTSRFDNVQTLPLIEEPVLAENTDLAHAVRGYDTPELIGKMSCCARTSSHANHPTTQCRRSRLTLVTGNFS